MKQISYKEVASTNISDNEVIVLSECSEGGYTLGKKVLVDVNGKKVGVFLKGALRINTKEGLIQIKNMLEGLKL